jgi:glycosidase
MSEPCRGGRTARERIPVLPFAFAALASGCGAANEAGSGPHAESDPSWIASTAIYEVFVRDFSPTGDFRGLIEGLDRIEALGMEVVWLMPIHPIGEVERKGPLGSPYSVRDYRALNPDFGDEDDFRALVRAVHERGMKLIIDWVPNHTAWDHDWVERHPEFYARDGAGRMTVPRDTEGELTDWTDVVELDYDNPDLRRVMIAEMRYWLEEFGIDGFRVDVAGLVPDDFWLEALPRLREAGASLLLAEWGDPGMHELGFDLTYPWDSYHGLKAVWEGAPASAFVQEELEDHGRLPEGGLRLRFTTNHDETAWDAPPVVLFGGPAGARAAFVATALLPGAPLIYNGQEVESPQELGLFVREPIVWDRPGSDEAREFYRRVIDLARNHEAFTSGDFEAVEVDPARDVIAYRRGDALVLVNPRSRPVRARVPGVELGDALDLLGDATAEGDAIELPEYGVAVLELQAAHVVGAVPR